MRKLSGLALWFIVACATIAVGQTPPPADPFQALAFLEGTWQAKTAGLAGGDAAGSYVFRRELNGHVLARHTLDKQNCQAAQEVCDHQDLLYIYQETPGAPLRAIYFDSEGHTIHYSFTSPAVNSVVFLSETTANGMRFRLSYALKEGVMTGRFELQPPGQQEWHTYLQWSGKRVSP